MKKTRLARNRFLNWQQNQPTGRATVTVDLQKSRPFPSRISLVVKDVFVCVGPWAIHVVMLPQNWSRSTWSMHITFTLIFNVFFRHLFKLYFNSIIATVKQGNKIIRFKAQRTLFVSTCKLLFLQRVHAPRHQLP